MISNHQPLPSDTKTSSLSTQKNTTHFCKTWLSEPIDVPPRNWFKVQLSMILILSVGWDPKEIIQTLFTQNSVGVFNLSEFNITGQSLAILSLSLSSSLLSSSSSPVNSLSLNALLAPAEGLPLLRPPPPPPEAKPCRFSASSSSKMSLKLGKLKEPSNLPSFS